MTSAPERTVVRAAGGVVRRRTERGLEILAVHRPRYDDWTLPKGKAEGDEPDERTALREVEEETGWTCVLGPELPSVSYRDSSGRAKHVRYWLMSPVRARPFAPNDEVDRVRWMPADEAETSLTYRRDLDVVQAALALDEPVYLVRHAKAGSRGAWRRDDHERPITKKGQRQAERLADRLAHARPARIVSSPFERCEATLRPIAERAHLVLERDDVLAEGGSPDDVLSLIERVPGPAILCTHGDVVEALVGAMSHLGVPMEGPLVWKKGSTWVLERDGGQVVRMRYVPPPRDRV